MSTQSQMAMLRDQAGSARLDVIFTEGRFTLTTSDASPLTEREYQHVARFAEGRVGCASFLEEVRARMER